MDGRQLRDDDLEPVGFDWSKLRKASPSELLIRFVFGGGIALVAAISGSVFGPRFGGLFLAFPAVLPATLTLIEKKEGTTKAWADASGGVLGAIGLAPLPSPPFSYCVRTPWSRSHSPCWPGCWFREASTFCSGKLGSSSSRTNS